MRIHIYKQYIYHCQIKAQGMKKQEQPVDVTMHKLVGGKYWLLQQNRIGRGGNGDVYKWEQYAIKVIKFNKQMKQTQRIAAVNQIKHEAKILKQFNHQNVVKLIDFIQEDGQFYLVMERCEKTLMEAGTIVGQVMVDNQKRKTRKFSQAEALQIFAQILAGYNYLIEHKVVHRDIKPANCLISKGVVKIADFGLSRQVKSLSAKNMKTFKGTWPYSSPQILKGEKYSSKSDIWSLGILLYEMIAGKRPFFSSNSCFRVIQQIEKQKVPKFDDMNISQDTQKLIQAMLGLKQSQRIDWEPLFKKFNIDYCPSPKKQKPQQEQQLPKPLSKTVGARESATKNEYKMQNLLKSILYSTINYAQEDCQPPKTEKKIKNKTRNNMKKNKIASQKNVQQVQKSQDQTSICSESNLSENFDQVQSTLQILQPGANKQQKKRDQLNVKIYYDITLKSKQPIEEDKLQIQPPAKINEKLYKQSMAKKNKNIKQNGQKIKQIFQFQMKMSFGVQKCDCITNKKYLEMTLSQRTMFQETIKFFHDNFKQMVRIVYSQKPMIK